MSLAEGHSPMDEGGRQVGRDRYENVACDRGSNNPDTVFRRGMAFVQKGRQWGAIGVDGAFRIPLGKLDAFGAAADLHLRYMTDNLVSIDWHNKQGYYNTRSDKIVAPGFDAIDYSGLDRPLCAVTTADGWGYIDASGKLRWEAKRLGIRGRPSTSTTSAPQITQPFPLPPR